LLLGELILLSEVGELLLELVELGVFEEGELNELSEVGLLEELEGVLLLGELTLLSEVGELEELEGVLLLSLLGVLLLGLLEEELGVFEDKEELEELSSSSPPPNT